MFFAGATYAQKIDTVRNKNPKDSLRRVKDSLTSKPIIPKVINKKNVKLYTPDSTHSPGLAFKRSGFVPGWGQLYNHKWWKVPIIYTGLGLLGSAIVFNQKSYKQYLTVYNYYRGDPTAVTPQSPEYELYSRLKANGVSQTAIENAVNGYQRNMQLSILGVLAGWGIQMIDAYIDAKFMHSYTMDRDLSFKVSPGLVPNGPVYASGNIPSVMPGIKLTFTMK